MSTGAGRFRRLTGWLVLRPFPPEFRERFGAEICESLSSRLSAARRKGPGALLRAALHSAGDLLAAGLAERRDSWRRPGATEDWWSGFNTDAKAVLRGWRRRPSMAGTLIITLGLGIASVVTTGGWAWGVLLSPIPGVVRQHRLVAIETTTREGSFIDGSYLDFQDLAQARSLSGAIAFREEPLTLSFAELDVRIWAQMVSTNYFDVLGVRPVLGRFFEESEHDAGPGAAPVVVVSHAFWHRVFGGEGSVVGRTVRLNGQIFTIIGVAPEDFVGTTVGLGFDLWVPVLERFTLEGGYASWHSDRGSRPLHMLGRLRESATLGSARQEMRFLAERLADRFPETNRGLSYSVLPIADAPYGAQSVLGSRLWSLVAVAALVALIVIANVSNLLLAAENARQREAAIRSALGASPWHITRQVFLQALLLALAAAVVSVAVSPRLHGLLTAFLPSTQYPVALQSPPVALVLVLSGVIALLTGVLLGALPLMGRFRVAATAALKVGGDRLSGGRHRLRGALVVVEVAMAFLVACGAGILVQHYHRLRHSDPGFDGNGIVLAGIDMRTSDYDNTTGPAAVQRALESLRGVPGVAAAEAAEQVPLGFGAGSWEVVTIEGYAPDQEENMRVEHNTVTPGYFDLLGIALSAGRAFTADDRLGTTPVMVVNEAFVRRWLPEREALGTRVEVRGEPKVIVGVITDIKMRRLDETPFPYMYFPLAQDFRSDMGLALHIRSAAPPDAVIAGIQQNLREVAPSLSVTAAMRFADYTSAATFGERVGAVVMATLGAVATLLAALGLYTLMNVVVSERTHELGVRAALGAARTRLVVLVLGRGLRTVVLGLLLGVIVVATAAGKLGSAFGASGSTLPLIATVVAATLTAIAIIALLSPALRASRIHPLTAIRGD